MPPSLVAGAICPTSLPLEKVDRVGVWLDGNLERCSGFPFFLTEGELVDAHLEYVFDGRDLVVGGRVFDLVDTIFGEEALVPESALGMFCTRMEGRQPRISKATVFSVVDVDDCMLLDEECGEIPELKARERDVFGHL